MASISRNRRVMGVFFLILFLVCVHDVWAAGKGEKAKKTPVLVISQPTFEAGKVLEGDEVVHSFILQNKGDADLIIKSVKPG